MVMSMCRVLSCVVGRGCLLWPVHYLGKTLLAFALLHSVLQGQIFLLLQVFLDFLLLHSSPLYWKRHLFGVLILEILVALHQFSSVQSLSHVQLFVTPWIAACQASLSNTNSWSLLRLMSIKSVMPSSHLILSSPFSSTSNSSQHQSLFQWVNSSHLVAKVLELQL